MALLLVRSLHSAVFLVELWAILWLVVTGLVGRRDRSVAGAFVLVAAGPPCSWPTVGPVR